MGHTRFQGDPAGSRPSDLDSRPLFRAQPAAPPDRPTDPCGFSARRPGLGLQTERCRRLEIRALASAADASIAWDLRCEIREKLVAFVQENYPGSLPRLRASLEATRLDIEPA
jgi:hypothetical protein